MSTNSLNHQARCLAEIREIEAYWRAGGSCPGALIGWLDWHAELHELSPDGLLDQFEDLDHAEHSAEQDHGSLGDGANLSPELVLQVGANLQCGNSPIGQSGLSEDVR
jgi:hypothetical protein